MPQNLNEPPDAGTLSSLMILLRDHPDLKQELNDLIFKQKIPIEEAQRRINRKLVRR